MRLPHHIVESIYFVFSNEEEFLDAVDSEISPEERSLAQSIAALGLPPITSHITLATMLGVNPGIIWSFVNKTQIHYRKFSLKNGNKIRIIEAPKVSLKIFQKWFSYHLQRKFAPAAHVFGFTPGKSHISAASMHLGAEWVFSVDIRNFFQTTPKQVVEKALLEIGYPQSSTSILAKLCCLNGFLPQGAPTSPILSNMVFHSIDQELKNLATRYEINLTRYADDIVFSGKHQPPESLEQEVSKLLLNTPWQIADNKTELNILPNRLKVHGLLVHGTTLRLTKGYRNRIRMYKYLASKNYINDDEKMKILGHINYAKFIDNQANKTRADAVLLNPSKK